MRTLSARGRVVVLSIVACTWGMLTYACSADDENPAVTRTRAPTPEAGSTTPTGEDGGVLGAPVCDKYGGATAVGAIASSIITTGQGDCRIGPTLTPDGETAGCWTLFVQSVFQCPGVETFQLGKTKIGEKTCNSYLPGVQFSNADFNAFSEDVKATLLANNISEADIKSIAPAFEGTRLKLVGGDVEANKFTECAPNCQKGGEQCNRDAGLGDGGIKDGGPKDTGPADTGPKDTGTPDADN